MSRFDNLTTFPHLSEPLRRQVQVVDVLVNRLWTKAASQPGYSKIAWLELQAAINGIGQGVASGTGGKK